MLHYFPRNWGWYLAAVCLFGPYVLIRVMDDEVLARVIGSGLIPMGVTLSLLWALFSVNYDWLQPTEWLQSKLKSVNTKTIFIVGKILLLGTFLLFLPLTWDYLTDVAIYRQNDIPSIITTISDIRTGTGALSVTLFLEGEPRRLHAYYFPRNTFEEGYTYKLWYLPNSARVIDAELISTNDTE
ncbi:MAG: hypothetical protein MUF19_03595 [Candidatus Pacebacteria bacterium]|nr:hypothetical protein [Candidatus Paceibacterota bacterium]